MDRSTGRALALLAAVFVAGGAAGWGVGNRVARKPHGPRDPQERLAYLLNLSPAQRESVQAVLERYRDQMQSIWRESRPRVDSLRGIIQAEVYAQLTPVQQDQFRALVALHARQRESADEELSEELLDQDRDGVPQRSDKCPSTPKGTHVDSLGCTTHSDHAGAQ